MSEPPRTCLSSLAVEHACWNGHVDETVHGVTPGPSPVYAAVTISRGPDPGCRFWLGCRNVTVLGRHSDCDISLYHPTVSSWHAEIHHNNDEFILVDLGSLNGSYVDAKPVDTIQLSHYDEISIGIFRLVFAILTGR